VEFFINNRFLRFLVIGGINTAFSYSLYVILLFIGLHYLQAGIVSFILSIFFNFETTRRLVFKNNDRRLLLKFIFSYLIILVISLFFLNLLVTIGISPYLAGLLNVLPMAIISFLIQKVFVFR